MVVQPIVVRGKSIGNRVVDYLDGKLVCLFTTRGRDGGDPIRSGSLRIGYRIGCLGVAESFGRRPRVLRVPLGLQLGLAIG